MEGASIKFFPVGVLEYGNCNQTHVMDYLKVSRMETKIPVMCSADKSMLYIDLPSFLRYNGLIAREGAPDLNYQTKVSDTKKVLDDMAATYLKIAAGSFVTRNFKKGLITKAREAAIPSVIHLLNRTDKYGQNLNVVNHLAVFDLQADLYESLIRKTDKTYDRYRFLYETWAKANGKMGMNFISQILANLDSAGYAFASGFVNCKKLNNLGEVKMKYVSSFDYADQLINRFKKYKDEDGISLVEHYFHSVLRSKDNAADLKLYYKF